MTTGLVWGRAAWDTVLRVLDELEVAVEEMPTQSSADRILRAEASGDSGTWPLWAHLGEVDAPLARFSVWCTWPHPIPAERLDEVAAWVALANPAMSAGRFEIDPDDDVLSLRRATDVVAGRLDPDLIRALLAWTVETFDDALGILGLRSP